MPILPGSYDLAMRLLRTASPLLSGGSSKLARGIRGRSGAARTLSDWARLHRDPTRPFVWTHAPSVGEGLQAKAVLDALLHIRPELQGAFTFFSPSAVGLAERMPVHVASYLPWDIRKELDPVVRLMRPDLVVFTKTEVWPGLTAAAVDRGVPVLLSAATLPEAAGRLGPVARRMLRPSFAALDRVMAISAEDADRFTRLGVRPDRIEVTGDPGIDSAWRRAKAADPAAPYLRPFAGGKRPILVAGSTWQSDEEVLIPAVSSIRRRHPELRMVVAPHEPTRSHLETLEARLAEAGLRSERLGTVESRGEIGGADVIVVDRVGVLAHLYTVGTLAYVGGGFHGEGLHSVLEPAAAGIPTAFGPRHSNSRSATELERVGAARSVEGAESLEAALVSWLDDASAAGETGVRASGYISQHRGAAMRTAKTLADYLPTDRN